ncbi:MAG: TraR/DksA family transcriptional regulator [Nitrospina sp.]|nr:TraR/DksA family transcriptional regulator [Nitrospina sp.]
MNSKKMEKFKQVLIELRNHLSGDVEKNRKTSQTDEFTEMLADTTDEAARLSTRQILLNLGEQGREKLKLIEEALDRIEEGSFGTCQLCEKNIPEARLRVVPFAQYCVTCLDELEKEKSIDRINTI